MVDGGQRARRCRAVTRSRWCRDTEPIAIPVRCGADKHVLLWHAGRLQSTDHDLTAESVLVALGGTKCRCLEIFEALRSGDIDRLPIQLQTLVAWVRANRAALTANEHTEIVDTAATGTMSASDQRTLEPLCTRTELWRLDATTRRRAHLAAHTAIDHTLEHGIFPEAPGQLRRVTVWTPRNSNALTAIRAVGTITQKGVTLRLHLRSTWARDIWAKGFATPSGALVLDVIEPRADTDPIRVHYVAWTTNPLNRAQAIAIIERGVLYRSTKGWHLQPESRNRARRHIRRYPW